jgi:hypothetical protein
MRPDGHTSLGWTDTVRDWVGDRLPVNVDEAHLLVLQRTTRLLRDTAAAPWHVRLAAAETFAVEGREAPEYADVGVPLAGWVRRIQALEARLRCAAAAVDAERYRLRHGRWPETLEALVPDFLREVGLDPFDGRPLKCRRLADGFVIYAVGPDGIDDGGNVKNSAIPPDKVVSPTGGTDIGFRLWDPAYRGLPADR